MAGRTGRDYRPSWQGALSSQEAAMPHRLALYGAVAVGALISLTVAAPSSAQQLFHEHFSFTDSHIEQDEHGSDFCPDIEFLVRYDAEVRGLDMGKLKGNNPFPYFSSNFKANEIYTNLENGKTFRLATVGRDNDQRIVDNGDGTISITFKHVGRTHAYGPDGRRLFSDSGQFLAQAVVDYNGTPGDPDDDVEISFEVLKAVGHLGTEGRDFCEDLQLFLG
jgi:hypothetical protein